MAVAMTDKLGELRQIYYGCNYTPMESRIALGDVEEGQHEISEVLMSVDEITRNINVIVKNIESIRRNHATVLASFQNKEAVEENERLMEEVKTYSHRVHKELKRMKQEIEEGETGPDRNSADIRIHKAQYSTLSRRFRDVMEEYNQMQDEYREKNKLRIEKQLKYTGREVSDEQLEEMIEAGDTNVFTQDILVDTAQRRQALSEVEARHLEIIHLEANIRELHDMFYDMARLVDEQGELIDIIEQNVERATVYVMVGRRSVTAALQYQRSSRKIKWVICCIISGCLLVLITIVVIVIAIAAYYVTNN